jgi:two-component system, sensor histidine kinase and response regulator
MTAVLAIDPARLVLVAEDNETNQYVITKQLAVLGYTAHIAADGREALERWAQGAAYSLLLTDLHMPRMDGYELAAAIRQREPDGARLPIVALTANADKNEIGRCREVGMDGHMVKPLQLIALHAMLQKWMPAESQPLPLRAARPVSAPSANAPATVAPGPDFQPAVDLAVLKTIVGSEPDVIRRMLASFRTSAARSREAIRHGVEAGNCKEMADAAHSLKSAARSLGALRLAAVCDEMEESADAGRTLQAAAQLPALELACGDVDRFLDEY